MILELARLQIKPGMEAAFEQGVTQAVPLFQRATGCHGLQLLKSIEQPSSYTLMVRWETVDDHTLGFRRSHDYLEWRRLVGACFAGPPEVEHAAVSGPGF